MTKTASLSLQIRLQISASFLSEDEQNQIIVLWKEDIPRWLQRRFSHIMTLELVWRGGVPAECLITSLIKYLVKPAHIPLLLYVSLSSYLPFLLARTIVHILLLPVSIKIFNVPAHLFALLSVASICLHLYFGEVN